mmetsp:Transcript_115097/g.311044  ORF Transcript_115097/g.311044 Transcript_115097/m.311044 type:complete len:102 (-) Transcript_115097:378-683(-)
MEAPPVVPYLRSAVMTSAPTMALRMQLQWKMALLRLLPRSGRSPTCQICNVPLHVQCQCSVLQFVGLLLGMCVSTPALRGKFDFDYGGQTLRRLQLTSRDA